jgi:hypothetical protein
VKVPLIDTLGNDSTFFEEVVFEQNLVDPHSVSVHHQSDQLTETTGIIIFVCFGIAECFQDGVAFQDLLLWHVERHFVFLVHFGATVRNGLERLLVCLCFA